MKQLSVNYGGSLMRILLLALMMCIAGGQLYAQGQPLLEKKINIGFKNEKVLNALAQIQKQSGVKFSYNRDALSGSPSVSVESGERTLGELFAEISKQTGLEFKVENDIVMVRPAGDPGSGTKNTGAGSGLTVNGTISSSTGGVLAGASVTLKGSSQGVAADANGKFVMHNVPENAVLQISQIGYETLEQVVRPGKEIVAVLKPVGKDLEQVVVIGYGTQRKKDVIGAVASVNTKNLGKLTGGDVSNLLQGQAAGVNAAPGSADPGAKPLIRVRGLSTIGNNEPLYIIDGIPGDIAAVNPADIQSIDILKDASAATIYGSRASNGVVIITTKRGKEGKLQINISSYYGVNSLGKKVDVTNREQYNTIIKQAFDNDGSTDYPDYVASDTYVDANGNTQQYANTDWQDAFFRNAPESKLDFSISGGTKDMKLNVALGKYSLDGIAINTGFTKYNLQVNTDFTKGKLKFGQSFTYSYSHRNLLWGANESTANGQNAGFSSLYYPIITVPHRPIYDPNNDGGYSARIGNQMNDDYNPVGIQELITNYTASNIMIGNVYAEYQILEPLSFKLQYGVNFNDGYSYYHEPTYYMGDHASNTTASLSEFRDKTIHDVLNAVFTYNKIFNDVHSVNVIAGYSQETDQYQSLSGANTNLPSNILLSLGGGIGDQSSGGALLESSLRSYFARVNYSYNGTYLLGASIRRDGSSRFSDLNRYGTFYSGTAAWRISNEDFFRDNIHFINDLKLRASYGTLGNQAIPDYLYLPPPVSTNDPGNDVNINYPLGPGLRQAIAIGNIITSASSPNIQWEQSATANIGFDLSMFKDKVLVVFDAFKTKTKDMLIRLPLPPSGGLLSNPLTNGGEMENKGIDVSATYRKTGGDVHFDITTNFTLNRNKVLKLGTASEYYLDGYLDFNNFPTTRTQTGYEIGQFYLFKTNGVIKTDKELQEVLPLQPNAQLGDLRFEDVNGDGQLNDDDRIFFGSGLPKFEYGVTGNVYYKNFDLNIFIQGTQGNKMYNGIKRLLYTNNLWNKSTDLLNAWSPSNPNSDVVRNTIADPNGNFSRPSDLFLEDGSYLRLKSIQLGYAPRIKGLNSARIYVGATNVFTITKYDGFDPGVVNYSSFARGVDRGLYPLSRSFYAGFSLNF